MPLNPETRVLFVHNFATHYTLRTFELLSQRIHASFLFYSDGSEAYWRPEFGVRSGRFPARYLKGFSLFGTRIVPGLAVDLFARPYDAVIKCINGRFALPLSYLAARLRGKPFVLWTGIWMKLQTPLHRLVYPLTRYIYRNSDAIVTYGAHVKEFLLSQGVPEDKIFVTRHAVDNSLYSRAVPQREVARLKTSLSVPPESRILLYLGRLERIKGLEYLLEAFARVSSQDAVLVIAGPGSLSADLESLASRLHIAARVRFPGYVPVEEAVVYYAASYAYILPSVTTSTFKEPWGLVVNEAFNQGLPVIASDAVGAAAGGLVHDGETGLVVPERDAVRLAAAMQRILESQALRDRLSQAARALVANWNQEQMVDQFQAAVEFALQRRLGASHATSLLDAMDK